MILDGDIGNVIRCDRCGKVHDFENSDFKIKQEIWWSSIFKKITRPDCLVIDFCKECAIDLTPLVYQLADVMELKMYVNKLERTINETRKQRTKNHWATTDDASECRQRCPQRRLGHRSCDGTS